MSRGSAGRGDQSCDHAASAGIYAWLIRERFDGQPGCACNTDQIERINMDIVNAIARRRTNLSMIRSVRIR